MGGIELGEGGCGSVVRGGWVPACAGMTERGGRNDGWGCVGWVEAWFLGVPACAGMTRRCAGVTGFGEAVGFGG